MFVLVWESERTVKKWVFRIYLKNLETRIKDDWFQHTSIPRYKLSCPRRTDETWSRDKVFHTQISNFLSYPYTSGKSRTKSQAQLWQGNLRIPLFRMLRISWTWSSDKTVEDIPSNVEARAQAFTSTIRFDGKIRNSGIIVHVGLG